MTDSRGRTRFTVYEVQEVTSWQVFRYDIRAATFDQAVVLARSGEFGPVDEGTCGETEFGLSGFGRSRVEAAENLGAQLPKQND